MTWAGVHERAEVLEAVLARAEQRQDGLLPSLDVAKQPPAFASSEELLLAVFRCWQRRLLTRLDAVVEREGDAACDDVAREVAAIARQWPGLSAIVAVHLDAPAVSTAWRRCAELVGMATGLPMEVELAGQLRGAVAGVATPGCWCSRWGAWVDGSSTTIRETGPDSATLAAYLSSHRRRRGNLRVGPPLA